MISRSVVARSGNFVSRRAIPRRPTLAQARFQSSASYSKASSGGFDASHVASGVAGGLTVVLAGYAWYHTSGLKNAVQATKDMKNYLQSTRDKVLTRANEAAKNPSQALANLRSVAKSYTFFLPGVGRLVDEAFDELEYLYDTHADEMDVIIKEATGELIKAIQNRRPDAETARKVSNIAGNAVYRMKELGGKAGRNFLERYPTVREKLGSSYEQLQNVAEKAGSEGTKALREAKEQMNELVAKNKLDETSIRKVRESMQEKASKLRRRVDQSEGVEKNVSDKDE